MKKLDVAMQIAQSKFFDEFLTSGGEPSENRSALCRSFLFHKIDKAVRMISCKTQKTLKKTKTKYSKA